MVVLNFALVYLIWGSTYLGIRYAIETIPTFLMAGTRFLVAGVILFAWGRGRGAPRLTAANWRDAAIVGGLLLLCGNGGVVWAETRVLSGIAALLVATVPVWMVLIEWLRPGGTRPTAGVFAGLALGLAGLVILIGPGAFTGAGGSVDALGALALTAGSIAWAVGSIYAKGAALPKDAVTSTGAQMLCGGTMMLAVSIASGQLTGFHLRDVSAASWWGWVYLMTVGSVVGYTAYVWLLNNVTSAKASTYAYVNPVVAVILGWAMRGEPITARTLVAAAVIIAAVVLITLARSRPVAATPRARRAA
jgi:drug/metabolite transporter (DMT)-like permease